MTAVDRAAHLRRRQRIFLIFTAVLCLAYARQLLTSPTAGQDFRAFFAAATVAAAKKARKSCPTVGATASWRT